MDLRFPVVSVPLALLLAFGSGCGSCGKSAGDADASASSADPEATLSPISATTSGGIAIGNLSAQLGGQERRVVDQPNNAGLRAGVVELLLTRGELMGKISDYQRASDLADALVRDLPNRHESWKARASTNATWHRFTQALADLDAAEKAGAPKASLTGERASILTAMGKPDEGWAFAPNNGDASGVTLALGSRAYIEGELGRVKDAEDDFGAARKRYRDVSPFPLAWLDATEALMFEKNGDRAKARAYYTRAVRILPQFARAASHLAGYETAERAVAILTPVAAESDDPEVHAVFGDALRRVGRVPEGKAEIDKARADYETLVARHREAFADHAARFYLGAGADPARALPLAADNAKNRPTDEALALWLEAAQGAGDAAAACDAARALMAAPHATETLRAPARKAITRCATEAGTP